MSETSGFFDAEEQLDGNWDREYLAEQWANYFKLFIGNGVFSSPTNQLKVVAYSGMNVKVLPGWAFINGYWYHNDSELVLEIPVNVTTAPIESGIFIQWDSSTRQISAIVGNNRTVVNRVAPYYELEIAKVYVDVGATTITDADITDMRPNTSVCGFVTGIIDVIDSTDLFAQYQAIFDQFMASIQTEYEAWKTQHQEDFEDWVEEQQTFFLDWFDHMKDQLSEDAAGHLQLEIDEINEQGLSGSIFTLHTDETTLRGKTVSVTSNGLTKTGTFDINGNARITGFTEIGTVTISATDGTNTATVVINTPYFANYPVTLAFWAATVNISTSSSELYGATITVKKDGVIFGTTAFDQTGSAVYTAPRAGEYAFECTYEGEVYSATVNVTQETTYNVSIDLVSSLNYEDWLTAGGLNPSSYANLSEVLADEQAVRRLMTIHDAVDYLATAQEDDEMMETIIADDLCAKWINLRDYAFDVLSANVDIKVVMDEVNKYGYGEWICEGQVPVMTSNTAPYGEASNYVVFDGKDSTDVVQGIGSGVGFSYHFIKPVICKMMSLYWSLSGYRLQNFKIQASNDGTTWVDLYSKTDSQPIPNIKYSVSFDNDTEYSYYRLYILSSQDLYTHLGSLQFYAYQPKGNVPIMTSNTAPYGTASAYQVFDGSDSTSASGTDFSYQSVNPICVKAYKALGSGGTDITGTVQGSNDGSTWNDITLATNTTFYLYHRLHLASSTAVYTLQFYGREMKVSVPAMTSNTAPYGEASSNPGSSSSHPAWHAFDKTTTNSGDTTVITPNVSSYISYDFKKQVRIKKILIQPVSYYGLRMKDFKVQGSNDGINWIDIYTGHMDSSQASDKQLCYYDFDNDNTYRFYNICQLSSYASSGYSMFWVYELNFFGFDYSERDWDTEHPMKYLYDHGVELEEITLTGTATKESYDVKLIAANDQASKTLDTTDYDLLRAVVGKYASGTNVLIAGSGNATFTAGNMPYNQSLDVSSVNGDNAVGVEQTSTGIFTAEEWWLE